MKELLRFFDPTSNAAGSSQSQFETIPGEVLYVPVKQSVRSTKPVSGEPLKKVSEIIQNDVLIQTVVDNILDVIYSFDSDNRVSYISGKCEEFYGYTQQEFLSDPDLWIRCIHPEDVLTVINTFRNSALSGKPIRLEYRIVKKNEELRWVCDKNISIYNEKGKLDRRDGSITDITERKNFEETLRIQRRAIESAAEGIVITNPNLPDNPIIFANEKFCENTGYSSSEVLGKNLRFLNGSDTSVVEIQNINNCIRTCKTFRGEIQHYRKDGTPFWNLLVIAPVFDERGNVTHYVSLQNDVTENKKWQEALIANNAELKKINSELDRFVYSASHDLRAPLVSVLGLINVAEMDTADPAQKQYLNMMRKSINKLDGFIQDIIIYSRNSRLDVVKNTIDFKSIIDEVVDNLRFMEGAGRIEIYKEIEYTTEFRSDQKRISVILNNLFSNAIKYHNLNQKKPYVSVNVRMIEGYAEIKLTDNGEGIAAENHDKIFEMFFRASERNVGSGLGLYIVKEIIDKLNGTISFESTPGAGTTFIVRIPNV